MLGVLKVVRGFVLGVLDSEHDLALELNLALSSVGSTLFLRASPWFAPFSFDFSPSSFDFLFFSPPFFHHFLSGDCTRLAAVAAVRSSALHCPCCRADPYPTLPRHWISSLWLGWLLYLAFYRSVCQLCRPCWSIWLASTLEIDRCCQC